MPEFLDDIRSGVINRPMFWLFDRAFRTTEASDAFIRACKEGGALIVQTGGWSPMVCNPHDPGDVKRMKDAANEALAQSVREGNTVISAADLLKVLPKNSPKSENPKSEK